MPEVVYALLSLALLVGIIAAVVYAVTGGQRKSRERDESLAAIERKLDDLRENDRT